MAPQLSGAAEGKVRDSTPRSSDIYKLIYIYMLHTARIHVGLGTSNKCSFFFVHVHDSVADKRLTKKTRKK